MTRRNVGDLERISATNIRNAAGVITDPTTLVLKVRAPGATSVTTYTYGGGAEIVKDSTGNYHCDLPVTLEGVYAYSWIGTGAAAFAEGGKFYAHPDQTA